MMEDTTNSKARQPFIGLTPIRIDVAKLKQYFEGAKENAKRIADASLASGKETDPDGAKQSVDIVRGNYSMLVLATLYMDLLQNKEKA